MQWDSGKSVFTWASLLAVGVLSHGALVGCSEAHYGVSDVSAGDAGSSTDGGSSSDGEIDAGDADDAGRGDDAGGAVACRAGREEWDHDANPATPCRAWTTCPAGTSVATAGTATTDRICDPCVGGFTTEPNAMMCTPWSQCAPGTAVGSVATATADVTCTPCVNGYSTTANALTCTPWRSCAQGEYVTNAGTPTANRTCASCPPGSTSTERDQTHCDAVGACLPGSVPDGQLGCTACVPGEFCPGNTSAQRCSVADARWDHDQDPSTPCASWSLCMAGSRVASAGTATTDRRCEPCATGFSLGVNSATCAPWAVCAEGTQVASMGTSTMDQGCAPCVDSYSDVTNAEACRPWSECIPGSYVRNVGTPTNDTDCAPCLPGQAGCGPCTAGTELSAEGRCVACPAGTYCAGDTPAVACAAEDEEWDDDGDPATPCAPWTDCDEWGTLRGGDALTDRECFAAPLWEWRERLDPPASLRVDSMRFLDEDIVAVTHVHWHDPVCGVSCGWLGRLTRFDRSGTRWNLTELNGSLTEYYGIGELDVDAEGNVYIPVSTYQELVSPFGGTIRETQGRIQSFDASGTHRWTRTQRNQAFGSVMLTASGMVLEDSFGGLRSADSMGNLGAHHRIQITGGVVEAMTRTSTGGYMVAGRIGRALPGHVSAGREDVFLVGLSAELETLWTYQFGSAADESVGDLVALPDGRCVVVGGTPGVLPGQVNAGYTDAFVAWFDPATATLSLDQFGTPTSELARDVAVDEDGTLYVVGGADLGPRGHSGSAGFLRAYASSGALMWSREVRPGTAHVEGRAVIVDATRIAVGGSYATDDALPDSNRGAYVMVFPRE